MSNRSAVQAGKEHIPSLKHTVPPIQGNHGQARNIQHQDLLIQGFITTLLRIAATGKIPSGRPKDLTTGAIQLPADQITEVILHQADLTTKVTVLRQDLLTGVTALHQGLQTGVILHPQDLQTAGVILPLQGLQTPDHQEAAQVAVPHQAGVEDNLCLKDNY